MSNKQPLGKLEKIDIREYWAKEDRDFTPWLAKEENIAILGDEIGVELEVQQTEQHIGPFRADIVCVETTSNHKVLIENQLDKTDHSHLGQILTYAAGLDTTIVIWIADEFTEEHRAALDWLNNITDETINFFGIEIELWRIGDSLSAPKFNVVVRPNEWIKTVTQSEKISTTEQLYLEYWTEFRDTYKENKNSIRIGKALAQSWLTFPIGRSNFWLSASISKQKKKINLTLSIYGEERITYYNLLQQQQLKIEQQIGMQLNWLERLDKKESLIRITCEDVDPSSKSNWPKQHKMIFEKLELFHSTFAPLIKDLDAAEWQPENQLSASNNLNNK